MLHLLQDVFRPAPMMNTGGGLMIDMAKRRHMQMGAQMLAQAASEIVEAKQLLPHMPNVDVTKVGALLQGCRGDLRHWDGSLVGK